MTTLNVRQCKLCELEERPENVMMGATLAEHMFWHEGRTSERRRLITGLCNALNTHKDNTAKGLYIWLERESKGLLPEQKEER